MRSQGSFVVIIDGIILRQTAELLFDEETTRPARNLCAGLYRRCLEDFVFGLVFADSIGLVESVAQDRFDYLDALRAAASPFLTDIATPTTNFLELFATDVELRTSVARSLSLLDSAVGLDFQLWAEYLTREVVAYLGNDPSIKEPSLPADAYVFAKRPEYLRAADFGFVLPDWSMSRLTTELLRRTQSVGASGPALRELVERSVFTHVSIHCWYRSEATRAIGGRQLRLPYATRSSLERARAGARDIALIKETVTHAVLQEVLTLSVDRVSARERLLAVREHGLYSPIRDRLQEALLGLAVAGDTTKLDRLFVDLTRFQPTRVFDAVAFKRDTTGSGDAGHLDCLRATGGGNIADYLREFHRVFPETRPRSA